MFLITVNNIKTNEIYKVSVNHSLTDDCINVIVNILREKFDLNDVKEGDTIISRISFINNTLEYSISSQKSFDTICKSLTEEVILNYLKL